MTVSLIRNQNRESLFESAVEFLIESFAEIKSERIIFGLCGGRSIGGILQKLLSKSDRVAAADWSRLEFFLVDERVVPLTDPDSNFGLLRKSFFEPAMGQGLLTETQLHPFDPILGEQDYGISSYRKEFELFGGRFDIVTLGVGEDGHIAGAFPGGEWVAECEPNFIVFDDSPKPPPLRMTATPELIATAKFALGMFFGEDKREALLRFGDPRFSLEACPAKILQQVDTAVVLTDID